MFTRFKNHVQRLRWLIIIKLSFHWKCIQRYSKHLSIVRYKLSCDCSKLVEWLLRLYLIETSCFTLSDINYFRLKRQRATCSLIKISISRNILVYFTGSTTLRENLLTKYCQELSWNAMRLRYDNHENGNKH